MSEPEFFILITIAALVLALNGFRLVLLELIEVVVLWKKLKTTIKGESTTEQFPPSDHTRSKRQSD